MSKTTTTDMRLVPIDRLVPYVNNARTHSADQIMKLRSSLREFGFINPVIIDRAAVALYLLFGDGEPSAEVYGAAADRQQASIVFDVAAQMVKMTPALLKRSKILGANKRIINHANNGFYQVLSAEVGTKHGLNVSGLVLDEVHVQPDRKLYDVLTKGSGDAREQPLYFLITTAGTDTNSICYELHQKALGVLRGTGFRGVRLRSRDRRNHRQSAAPCL